MSEMMTITVNGEERNAPMAQTVGSLLALFGIEPKMVVVELNGEIVPRPNFDRTGIPANSTLEIVQMMAGG
jgi:sulfur carrier protein